MRNIEYDKLSIVRDESKEICLLGDLNIDFSFNVQYLGNLSRL